MKFIKPVSLFLILFVVVFSSVACGPEIRTYSGAWTYERLELPEDLPTDLHVRLRRHGKPSQEEVQLIDLSVEDVHYRISLSGLGYSIAVAKGKKLVSPPRPVGSKVIRRSDDLSEPAPFDTVESWLEEVNSDERQSR
ncbi:MAG TPA: hypothetical protein P5081_04920 [Phycisphaerae bacterium]|nr:hypothetical protein [Phycisphaerae bacterium]HRW52206.1 hypothetical protein [Phycisphaerae bacterium]